MPASCARRCGITQAVECLTCHTPVSGLRAGFWHGANLIAIWILATASQTKIAELADAGYFSAPFTVSRMIKPAADSRTRHKWLPGAVNGGVRSYLHANCAHAIKPGGTGPSGTWDARYHNPLSASGLIRGCSTMIAAIPQPRGHARRPCALDAAHALATRGQGQMPPLATRVLDSQCHSRY
jgi:hypothetical protein